MGNIEEWMQKRTLRSVDNLRLWGENPRLDPENEYRTTMDFVDEIVSGRTTDKEKFLLIVKSIATTGFKPVDPIVVWQNPQNQRYYVAEGNLRVMALKILRNPGYAPKSIRAVIRKYSAQMNKRTIEKIPVCVAPTFDDALWYIMQRNSFSSLQIKWSTEQQRRMLVDIYEKFNGDVDYIRSTYGVSESEIFSIIRLLRLKECVKDMKGILSDSDYSSAVSHRFPLTTIERFFNFSIVKERWFIVFDGANVIFNCDYQSFVIAYSELIRRMFLPKGENNNGRIDSRAINSIAEATIILDSLPTVLPKQDGEGSGPDTGSNSKGEGNSSNDTTGEAGNGDTTDKGETKPESVQEMRNKVRNDPNRNRLIPDFYEIESTNYRLADVFHELQHIPFTYKNSISASIRILLDLSVLEYIESENHTSEIKAHYKCGLRDITLWRRIAFIKGKFPERSKPLSVCNQLLNEGNQYSLDVLNGFIHSKDTHYLSKQVLNGFWDFLFPLLQKLITIKEKPL